MLTPLDAYKELIDLIASISDDDAQAIRIENGEPWPDTASLAQTNEFIERLSGGENSSGFVDMCCYPIDSERIALTVRPPPV